MSPAAQRVALAEAEGCMLIEGMWHNPDGVLIGFSHEYLDDYRADLNAVARVEATLTEDKHFDYVADLSRILGLRGAVFATAAQRCEALLRVLGKWDETR